MRILTVHNSYQQPGGEDAVFIAEVALLRQHGHNVLEYREDNWHINQMNRIEVAVHTIWSGPTRQRLLQLLREARCDVVHFHNIFPLISPSAYAACREVGVPVVQTLHNYRLLCPAATFFRHGRVCEACLGKTLPWPAVLHACYRSSHAQSALTATMLTVHRWLKTWQELVDVYITLTEFSRHKFMEGGIPTEKIVVKPNFVSPDPGKREVAGDYAIFVGRLSAEKGVRTLLQAWGRLRGLALRVVGDGPMLREAALLVRQLSLRDVDLLGRVTHQDALALMKGARLVILPSECYEGFPMTLVEAFACGVPVVASRLGAMAEIVEERQTGLLFHPGDAADLADTVQWAVDHPTDLRRMGTNARHVYEAKYTPERNYSQLLDIYQKAIGAAKRRR